MANANIFLQAPRVKSVDDWRADADAKALRSEQLKGAQRQNALADLLAQQQTQAMAETAADRGAIARLAAGWGADTTPDQRIAGLRNSGRAALMQQADALEKQWLDRRKTEADAGKVDAETLAKHLDAMKFLSQSVLAAPTSQNAALAVDAFERLTGRQMPEERQRLAQLQTPEQVRQWAAGHALKADELLPKLQMFNTGKQQVPVDMNALTNPAQQPLQMTTTPGEDLSAQTSRANNAATVGAAYANAGAAREMAVATRDAAKISADQKSETELRKEFADLPEVKNFKTAAPAYKAVVEAAKGNNPQADINLIYGLAKLYDPNSVVREGEYATIANSQSIPEWLKGHAQRLTGGGRLTEATKKQILEQASIRYRTMEGDMAGAQASYDGIATRRGLKPENVFPRVGVGSRPDEAPAAPKPGTVLKFDANGNPVK